METLRIGFDLDGTLYDTGNNLYATDERLRARKGYPPLDRLEHKRKYQTHDWHKFYRDRGIREEHIDWFIEQFGVEFPKFGLPNLVPGAMQVLQAAQSKVGADNLYIITQERPDAVRARFERDGLESLLPQVESPFEGKEQELFKLASKCPDARFAYVGDLVSDGEACKMARDKGAGNIIFYGLVHEYGMNDPAQVREFVDSHKSFSRVMHSIYDIYSIWQGAIKWDKMGALEYEPIKKISDQGGFSWNLGELSPSRNIEGRFVNIGDKIAMLKSDGLVSYYTITRLSDASGFHIIGRDEAGSQEKGQEFQLDSSMGWCHSIAYKKLDFFPWE